MGKELVELKNVGKAVLRDLEMLGIGSVEELGRCEAMELFWELERRTGQRQDPCVWDVFAAIIHEARTGEAMVWWKWTGERKKLQRAGKWKHVM